MPHFLSQEDLGGLHRFLSWWGSELVSIAHAIERTLFGSVPVMRCWYDPEKGFSSRSIEDDQSKSDCLALCANRDVEVFVPDSGVFRLEMSLPKSARRRIRSVVGFRLLQESPLSAESFYFDCAARPSTSWVEAMRRKTVTADVVIVHKTDVDSAIRTLESNAAATVSVGCAGTNQGTDIGFVFTRSKSAALAQAASRTNRLLAGSALALIVILPLLIHVGAWIMAQQVEAKTQTLKKQQATALALREQDERARLQRSDFLKATAAPKLTSLLAALATNLPPPIWLQRVHYEDGVLRVAGFASQPSAAAQHLTSSKLFRTVTLEEASQAPNQQDRLSLFELSATTRQPDTP
jgi:hypothetical protein